MSVAFDRQYIEELLPFWVNDTLSADERAEVESAMQSDAELRADAGFLRTLQDKIREDVPGYSPGEFGLARLMRDIDAAPQTVAPGKPRTAMFAGLAAAAIALAMVSLPSFQSVQQPVFEQASGDAGDVVLTVSFQPDLTEERLAATLLEHGLVIVDGPSALGLYRLVPVEGEADVAALARKLRAKTGIFESVDAPR